MSWNFETTKKNQDGKMDEELFRQTLLRLNPNLDIRPATLAEQRRGIDVWVQGVPIDVKGKKRIGLLNQYDDMFTMLEIKDSDGNDGWLLKDAHYIAFRRYFRSDWVIAPRLELLKLYRSLINEDTEWTPNHDQNLSWHKKHRRVTNDEEVTTVCFREITGLPNARVIDIPRDLNDNPIFKYKNEEDD